MAKRFDAEELAQLAAALNYPAPLDLRANPIKATPRRGHQGAGRSRHRRGRNAVRAVRRAGRRQAGAHAARRRSRTAGSKCRTKAASLLCSLVAPQARRDDRRLLRGRGRQDAGARRDDALHRPSLRVRRVRPASREAQAASGAQRFVERESGADRQRARRQDQAARGQDRPRARRCAVLRPRHAAPQSGPEVAPVAGVGRRTDAEAARRSSRARRGS